MQEKLEINCTRSFVKCLYFVDSPRRQSPKSPKKISSFAMGLPLPKSSIRPGLSSFSPASGLKNADISSIYEDSLIKHKDENYKRQLKNKYIHIPVYLPTIVKDKGINETKNTMFYFHKDRNFSQSEQKKMSMPFINKEDNIRSVKNAKEFNENMYNSRKNYKENTSKMLIKELWHKSYHKKVLDLSGLSSRQKHVDDKKIQSYDKRVRDLESHFAEPKTGYLKFLQETEKNLSDFINSSLDSKRNYMDHLNKIKEKSKNNSSSSREVGQEVHELIDKCKEFNDHMKDERK